MRVPAVSHTSKYGKRLLCLADSTTTKNDKDYFMRTLVVGFIFCVPRYTAEQRVGRAEFIEVIGDDCATCADGRNPLGNANRKIPITFFRFSNHIS